MGEGDCYNYHQLNAMDKIIYNYIRYFLEKSTLTVIKLPDLVTTGTFMTLKIYLFSS